MDAQDHDCQFYFTEAAAADIMNLPRKLAKGLNLMLL
jgi:hypothetical protein